MKLKFLIAMMLMVSIAACSPKTEEQAAAPAATDVGDVADTVYTNGKIYTVDEDQPWAEAVAIKDGKFLVVGSAANVAAVTGDTTEMIDMEGRFAMPGVFDLHSHPFITPWYGSMNLSLQNPGDADAILAEVKAYADANPDKEWIIGGQYLNGVFPGDSPSRELLDEIVPDRPVAMLDQTGHSMWINSKAMELAGINADTPTSQLIVIEKNPDTGEPSGTVREQAIQLVERVIPQATGEQYADPIEDVFEMFLSYGITAQSPAEAHRASLDGLKYLEENNRLHQRVFASWDWKTTLNLAYTLDDIEGQIKNRSVYESGYVRPNYVKIFADGSPASFTSALLEPYANREGFYGDANMTTEEFAEAFTMFDDWGVGVHVHTMGDGTSRRVVDALEVMKASNGDSGVRHKVAHNTMTTAEDLARIAALKDVNIDFSPPLWYPHAGGIATFQPPLGEERFANTYLVKTAVEMDGLHVGQGADWLTANPTPDPFIAIEGFVTRENPFDPEMEGALGPEQAITLEQAIAIATIEGAYVVGVEDELGSIEAGKLADFIVLDQNLFEIDVKDIYGTQVLRAVVDGKVGYDRPLDGNQDLDEDELLDRMQ